MSIELCGVVFGYRGSRVLEQLDWQVMRGEFHVLLGASGSGKTTLLRIIAGLEQPQSGRVLIDGLDVTSVASHRRGLSMVGQSAATYDHLTVVENLRYAERLSGEAIGGMREELVEQFGLGGLLGQKSSDLSGGQRQRLAIVRALLSGRRILLMDEPLAHLQEAMKGPIRRLMRSWQERQKLTCVYVTHDSQEACELADRISVMGDGRILQTGDSSEIYRRPGSGEVAELMGRPVVQWFRDPLTLMRVGLRPSDWQLSVLDLPGETNQDGKRIRGLDFGIECVSGEGTVVSEREVESFQWCDIQVGADLIRVVVSRMGAGIESRLIELGQRVLIVNRHPIWLH